jgi:hypothetical protein
LGRRDSAYSTNKNKEFDGITAVKFKLLLDLRTEVFRGFLSLFSLVTESYSKITSEACKPSTRETEVLVVKPPGDFILSNMAGVKLLVYNLRMFQEPTP